MPAYKRLIDRRNDSGSSIQVIALSLEDTTRLAQYLDDFALSVDGLQTVTVEEWAKLSATPTLLAVDGDGTVEKAWVGMIQGALETEVLSELFDS